MRLASAFPGPGPVRYAVYADIDFAFFYTSRIQRHIKKKGGKRKDIKASNVYSYIFATKGGVH